MKCNLRRRTREVKGRARSANAKLDPYNWDGSSPRLFFFVRVLVVVVFLPCNCNCSPSVFGIFVLLVFFGFVFCHFVVVATMFFLVLLMFCLFAMLIMLLSDTFEHMHCDVGGGKRSRKAGIDSTVLWPNTWSTHDAV